MITRMSQSIFLKLKLYHQQKFHKSKLKNLAILLKKTSRIMPFQLRKFQLISNASSVIKNQAFFMKDSFPDIYVFKPSIPNIGIKFRDIEQKKYGFKIRSVQVKIDEKALSQNSQYIDEHFNFYQDWKKYQIFFKYRLMMPSIYQDKVQLQRQKERQVQNYQMGKFLNCQPDQVQLKYQSFESQLKHLNLKLIDCFKGYFSKKSKFTEYLHQQNSLSKWLRKQEQIKDLFLVHKKKQKSWTWQTGTLMIKLFSEKSFQRKEQKQQKPQKQQTLVFKTQSAQSKYKSEIQEMIDMSLCTQSKTDNYKNPSFDLIYSTQNKEQNLLKQPQKNSEFKFNTSYPQLLQDIYQNYNFE